MSMEYDIIEKLSDLAASDLKLDSKLAEAARLLLQYFPFDQCLLYLDDSGVLKLRAGAPGRSGHAVEAYEKGEGLPGRASSALTPVEVFKEPDETSWEGIEDWGLNGARHAFVVPLKGGGRVYGVLYFKSAGKGVLSPAEKQMSRMAALQVVSLIRCSDLANDHRRVYDELLQMQQKLVNSEKLLALGDMAATLAHEIRNPLLSIGAYAARLRRQLPPGSPGLKYLEQMSADIARIEKIMDGIIRFLKDNAVELKTEDLNSIADEALTLFSDEFSAHNIKVKRRLSAQKLLVLADREQMKIAFDNLIANAIQSMENGGSFAIETALSGGFAVVRLTDTGGGIDPGNLGYIFNPFFTTKKHGTGLGLPIANSIVMRHKGQLEAGNEGPGAVFTIKIPYAGAHQTASVPPANGAA
jgi:signal transduction histidine kinase